MALSTRPVPTVGPTINEQFPIASFTSDGGTRIAFPIINISESGGNRIIEQERAYRDGAKLDDTGAVATRWSISCLFHNSIQENGLEANTEQLYPDVMNSLIQSFLVHETGDLILPTRGITRVRCESYTRTEVTSERECARLDVVFVEDNEDSVDASFLMFPTVQATGTELAGKLSFYAMANGYWTGYLEDLELYTRGLESVVFSPGDPINDLNALSRSAVDTTNRSIAGGRKRGIPGRDILFTPEATNAERIMHLIKDRSGKAKIEARRNKPPLQARVFSRNLSLSDIAFEFKIDYTDLLYSNPTIENPRNVPAGTVVFLPIG